VKGRGEEDAEGGKGRAGSCVELDEKGRISVDQNHQKSSAAAGKGKRKELRGVTSPLHIRQEMTLKKGTKGPRAGRVGRGNKAFKKSVYEEKENQKKRVERWGWLI